MLKNAAKRVARHKFRAARLKDEFERFGALGAFIASIHPDADYANRADRRMQPASFPETATVPLDLVKRRPVAH